MHSPVDESRDEKEVSFIPPVMGADAFLAPPDPSPFLEDDEGGGRKSFSEAGR